MEGNITRFNIISDGEKHRAEDYVLFDSQNEPINEMECVNYNNSLLEGKEFFISLCIFIVLCMMKYFI